MTRMPTRPHLTKKTKIWMIQTTQPPRDTPLVIFRVRQMFGWIGSQGETKRDGGIERSHNHSRTTTHNPTGLLSYCTSHESLPPQVTRHDALLTVEGPSTRTLQLISCRGEPTQQLCPGVDKPNTITLIYWGSIPYFSTVSPCRTDCN